MQYDGRKPAYPITFAHTSQGGGERAKGAKCLKGGGQIMKVSEYNTIHRETPRINSGIWQVNFSDIILMKSYLSNFVENLILVERETILFT